MLDIRFIRDNPDLVQRIAEQKRMELSVSDLLKWDQKRRDLLKQTEDLRAKRNQLTHTIATSLQQGHNQDAEPLKAQVKDINKRLSVTEVELTHATQQCDNLMMLIPNIVSPDTPVGNDDHDNVEVRQVGTPPVFDFVALDHVRLGEIHDLIDIPRGVKTAGSRNYYLKGNGLYLHLAVQRLALDLLTSYGFTAMDVPVMVRPEALTRTGFFPTGQDQTFEVIGEDKWLVGTSEVSLVSYYSDEIVNVTEPIRLAGVSACYRKEIGSAGRDVRGLYRVHQFAKVEQVVLCENNNEVSDRILQEITSHAEEILQLLELPYRVMAVCTGDMSQKTYKQYDIETWMPSRQAYGETHSSSNVLDFQARRSNIRYRDHDGKLQYCHTLNNTAVATPRILIPLLENHQQSDGSIYIPKALRPYMKGMDSLSF
ncbi:serine--tRNA ligase [Paenibacillus crassostreae]|uniref:Serine--tRNA ligase n=1 Tax=Paenibacillus crassostreae TaxID=1763538 RepID=A0A167BTL4_9BACL|nr:serine--tRNA ligase [Paenibacillus crassostreae]AOZ92480.1 serine--tRNA ligase [Paenibacillus crassostreae]OAB72428.1 serine--tRNA ligase [Paenibacillus crassostreae]